MIRSFHYNLGEKDKLLTSESFLKRILYLRNETFLNSVSYTNDKYASLINLKIYLKNERFFF